MYLEATFVTKKLYTVIQEENERLDGYSFSQQQKRSAPHEPGFSSLSHTTLAHRPGNRFSARRHVLRYSRCHAWSMAYDCRYSKCHNWLALSRVMRSCCSHLRARSLDTRSPGKDAGLSHCDGLRYLVVLVLPCP